MPSAVLIENVSGLESYNNGHVLREMQDRLSSLGYNTRQYSLDSSTFGIPQ